jgi:hypothetical protein
MLPERFANISETSYENRSRSTKDERLAAQTYGRTKLGVRCSIERWENECGRIGRLRKDGRYGIRPS